MHAHKCLFLIMLIPLFYERHYTFDLDKSRYFLHRIRDICIVILWNLPNPLINSLYSFKTHQHIGFN